MPSFSTAIKPAIEQGPSGPSALLLNFTPSGKLKTVTFAYHDGNSSSEYFYDKEGNLKERLDDFSGGGGSWTEKYIYNKAGKVIERIDSYDDGYDSWTEKYTYDPDEESEEIEPPQFQAPRYNAAGQMLLNGHYFNCTFDQFGNWTSKVHLRNEEYIIIERIIEYSK